MTEREFCIWLTGFLAGEARPLEEREVAMIRKHLDPITDPVALEAHRKDVESMHNDWARLNAKVIPSSATGYINPSSRAISGLDDGGKINIDKVVR
jgi:hypothetical protein